MMLKLRWFHRVSICSSIRWILYFYVAVINRLRRELVSGCLSCSNTTNIPLLDDNPSGNNLQFLFLGVRKHILVSTTVHRKSNKV